MKKLESKVPILENETKLSTTTNLYSSDRIRNLRIVQTITHPRICLDNGKTLEFIEVKDDSILDEVIADLIKLALKLKGREE
jgi:hypothetical protein